MGGILDRFTLTDRAAIVTGAGRGIGRASAIALAQAGADVVISSRTEEQLRDVAERIETAGRGAEVVACDLNETDNLQDLVDAAERRFGRVDVVVNNVGGTMPQAFLETSEQTLEDAFHFNVTTAFSLTRRATPLLLADGGGAVVNIGSAMGRLRDRGFVAYGTAKAALAHMTRLLAADLAPRVRVNAIAVGSVLTSALEIVADNDGIREPMERATPLRRLGQPEDIAAAVIYLTSAAGDWVTGKVLEVDGGLEAPNLSLGLPDLTPD